MPFCKQGVVALASLLLLMSGCGRDALPDSKQAVTSSGISSAASSTPVASPAPTEDPNADKMPYLFEEYISLPKHETLVPTEEQKQQLEAFIGRNPEEVCRFLDSCYGATTGICLLDITGDEVPEICVSGWMSNDAPSTEPLAELGSKTTIVFDLATGEYKGNFEGSPEDFYWCETESGSRVALGFELNWTRSYRSGPDVWLRTHILWEHKWQDGKIYSIPQWFYLYQSRWSDKQKVLHVLPHWNWEDRIGQKVPVFVYTNYPKAELFVNGKSMGVKAKSTDSVFSRYRLMWNDVVYQPGEIKVVAYGADGKPAAEKTVKTAGEPAQIKLIPEKKRILCDRNDLAFVELQILDKDGNLCPRANTMVFVRVEGNGRLRALCNGDASDLAAFSSNYMRAYNGKLMIVADSPSGDSGNFRITASTAQLKSGSAVIEVYGR